MYVTNYYVKAIPRYYENMNYLQITCFFMYLHEVIFTNLGFETEQNPEIRLFSMYYLPQGRAFFGQINLIIFHQTDQVTSFP